MRAQLRIGGGAAMAMMTDTTLNNMWHTTISSIRIYFTGTV